MPGLWRSAELQPASASLLFVYGTLRRCTASVWHERLLAPYADYVAEGRLAGRIVDLGAYPGLCPARFVTEQVPGEVWQLRPETAAQAWRGLDEYEGLAPWAPPPIEYARWCRSVRLQDGRRVSAWVYHYLL